MQSPQILTAAQCSTEVDPDIGWSALSQAIEAAGRVQREPPAWRTAAQVLYGEAVAAVRARFTDARSRFLGAACYRGGMNLPSETV